MKPFFAFLPLLFFSCTAQPKPIKTEKIDENVVAVSTDGLIKNKSAAIYFSFTTTLASPRTSAGVYDGDKLIRTLWSNVTFAAGKHEGFWDGKNDLQQFAPNGKYQIKVLKSGIEWDWRGTFFNSSDSTIGATKWHGTSLIGIQFMGNKAYALPYYLEGNYQLFTFNPANPNQKQTHGGLIQQSTFRSCTDGKYTYALASTDYDTYFVYAFDANGNEVNFANGKKYESHNSIIAIAKTKPDSLIAGVAVQKQGNYLFTSTPALNKVSVYNKTTGKLIRIDKVIGAGLMACDANNKLWVICNDVPTQFLVNADGSLTATGIILKGISNVQQLDISPDNATISLIDGGLAVQQIKSYNNTTGAPLWILGQLGGYSKTAIVSNDRFCFTAAAKDAAGLSFINYAPDGSFWVGDKGNFRYLHFDKNRHYINQFAFLPSIYNTFIDVNSPTHLYAEYLRATVDYNAPNPQKAWVLDRNYAGKIPYAIEEFEDFHKVLTLKNGKTYAGIRENDSRGKNPHVIQIVELTDSGIRNTGITYDWQAIMSKNGDIYQKITGGLGNPVAFYKKQLIGFDANNNPKYGFSAVYASIPLFKDSLPMDGDYTSQLGNGDMVLFNPGPNNGFHMGILPNNASFFRALFLPSVGRGTQAEYPKDGFFGNGNSTNNPGGQQNTIDSFIIWNHHGEFWNNSGQTSMWQMLDKNGLNIGVWGTLQDATHPQGECVAWNSGNATHSQIVKVDGDYFVCWDDESRHGGVHVAKIKNMNTLNYETLNVVKNTDPILVYSYTNLTDKLLRFDTLANGFGWTKDPEDGNYFSTKTGYGTYNPFLPTDVCAAAYNRTKKINRQLPGNGTLWKMSGSIAFPSQVANGQFTPSNYLYVKIYDANNKVIAQLENKNNRFGVYGDPHNFSINNITVVQDVSLIAFRTFHPFMLKTTSNGLVFSFMGKEISVPMADKTANALRPARLAIEFIGGDGASGNAMSIDLKDLKFWNDQ